MTVFPLETQLQPHKCTPEPGVTILDYGRALGPGNTVRDYAPGTIVNCDECGKYYQAQRWLDPDSNYGGMRPTGTQLVRVSKRYARKRRAA